MKSMEIIMNFLKLKRKIIYNIYSQIMKKYYGLKIKMIKIKIIIIYFLNSQFN